MSAALGAVIRGGRGTLEAEPPAWFAASVVARLHREEAERAERRLRWQHWARVLVPSGAALLLVLGLAIGEHLKAVSEQDQVTFAALDAIAQGGKADQNGTASVPPVVEGVSWSVR